MDNYYNYNTPLYKTYNLTSTEENINQNYNNLNEKNMFNGDNNKDNNYMNFHYDYIKDYENNNNYMNEKISKKIISQILQDTDKLNESKKNFGNDIGLKLLDGTLNAKEINSIYDFLKKNENKEEKNLFRGSKHNYRNYKYENNVKNDILLLKNSIRDNEYPEFNKNINNNDYCFNKEPLSNEY
jgi:hypothetical protein